MSVFYWTKLVTNYARIHRLAQVITAGIKEVRQNVIELQTAKPAIMYEPRRLLTVDASSDSPRPHDNTLVPVNASHSPVAGPDLRQQNHVVVEDDNDAVEPGRLQFEAAAWVYSMTLDSNRSLSNNYPISNLEYDMGDKMVPHGGVALPMAPLTRTPPHDQDPPDSMSMQMIRVPSPQRLRDISVPATVQSLIQTWTYLDPVGILPELCADPELFEDLADEDEYEEYKIPTTAWRREAPRRFFTAEEYSHALNTGEIYDASFQSRSGRRCQFVHTMYGDSDEEESLYEPTISHRPQHQAFVEDADSHQDEYDQYRGLPVIRNSELEDMIQKREERSREVALQEADRRRREHPLTQAEEEKRDRILAESKAKAERDLRERKAERKRILTEHEREEREAEAKRRGLIEEQKARFEKEQRRREDNAREKEVEAKRIVAEAQARRESAEKQARTAQQAAVDAYNKRKVEEKYKAAAERERIIYEYERKKVLDAEKRKKQREELLLKTELEKKE